MRQKGREALRVLIDEIVVAPDGPPAEKRGGGPVTVTVHEGTHQRRRFCS